MKLLRTLALALVGTASVACGGGVSLGTVPGALGSGDGDGDGGAGANGSPGSAGPYDITCTMWFEPATSDREETFTVRSDALGQKTMNFPGVTVNVSYAARDAAFESVLSVAVPELETVQTFRLDPHRRPAYAFIGDQGFSGLVYVGSSLQYVCKVPGASPGPATGNAAPFGVKCAVEVRSTPGGAVERSEVLDIAEGSVPVQLDGPGFKRTFDAEDFGGHAHAWDGPPGGSRSLSVKFWKKPNDESSPAVSQLFQLEPRVPVGSYGALGSLSGSVTLGNGSGRELSYSCGPR